MAIPLGQRPLFGHIYLKYVDNFCCRWEVVGSRNGIQYGPFPVPIHGLPARFKKESTREKRAVCGVSNDK